MRRRKSSIIAIICFGLLTASLPSFAQDKPAKTKRPDPKQGPEEKVSPKLAKPVGEVEFLLNQTPKRVPPGADGTFKFLGGKFAVGKLVTGAPYSATAVTESTQTLSDGNQIIRKNEASIYRDSEGRTRIEQRLETIGKWRSNGEAPLIILINDPVARVSYSLDPRTNTAHKNTHAETTWVVKPKMAGPVRRESLPIKEPSVPHAESEAPPLKKRKPQDENERELKEKPKPITVQPDKFDSGQRKSESLGTQVIEGVNAEGTRTTLTIPAGEIGNIQPIDIVDETWYSPELQLQVMTKHQDPRTGVALYRLTNINRSEPDRSLFEIPAGYTIDERPMFQPKPVRKPGE
jgi:hypothetical protein